jgi:NADH dehydrogenase FAD-containing subunit
VNGQYDFLHVTPPQKASATLAPLADSSGFVDIDKHTLQHVRHSNVFALGDCSNLPTSKTAAAVAGECNVLYQNLISQLNNQPLTFKVGSFFSLSTDKHTRLTFVNLSQSQ